MDTPASSRDGNGRFATGNPGGPGRSKGRGYELQRAAQEAITPNEMTVMMRKAMLLALQGNLGAMRFVAERVCGRAPEASIREPFEVELPPLRTIANCTTAIDRLVEATLRGERDEPNRFAAGHHDRECHEDRRSLHHDSWAAGAGF
jgi:hypothetical protein